MVIPIETGSRVIRLPVWKWGLPVSIWGSVYPHFHMVITIWKRGTVSFRSLYGNGDQHIMEMVISRKISISCPKFGGRYSSMRDLEVAKNTLPISKWWVPVQKWAGRVEYSQMGSPRFRIEFVSIWGSTPMYVLELYTAVLPAVFSVSVFCRYQICWIFGISVGITRCVGKNSS